MLLRSLIKNHPLVDGNKRMAMASAGLFLFMNRKLLLASSDDMVRFAVEVARSEPDMPWPQIADWLRRNTIPIVEDRGQAIRLIREKYEDSGEILERVTDRWADIANFAAGRPV